MLDKAIRLIRVYHNLSQTEAAAKLGLSKPYLSDIENGKKKVSMKTLEIYSNTFNMPISSLMFFAEKSQNPCHSEKARYSIASKALKMLEWIETISEEKKTGK